MQPWDIALTVLIVVITILIFIQINGYAKARQYNRKSTLQDESRLVSNMGGSMTIGDREVQEDCYYIKKRIVSGKSVDFLALADGMGESYGGKIASRTSIRVCEDIFSSFNILDNPKYFFKKIFNNANKEILKELDNGGKGYASLATALIYENRLYYSVVGNVKVFVYRNGDLVPVTTGHTVSSLSKNKFTEGKLTRLEALSLLNNHRLYNYLGEDGFKDLEIFDDPIDLRDDDIVVLASDGVYEVLSHTEAEQVLDTNLSSEQKSYNIIEAINNAQGENKDNASVVIWQSLGAIR